MARLWTPTPRTTPDEWGRNRVYSEKTGVPGDRNPFLTPYAVPWGRDLASGVSALAVLVCGAQMGKTDTMLDVIGERLDNRPANILYVGPSKEFNTDQFEPRFEELLEQSKSLRRKRTKGRRSKKTLKWVAGVRVRLAHAGSSTALKSDPASLALIDEYDEMLRNVKGQGDPLGLVRARGYTFADFNMGVTSTPSSGLVDSEIDMASGLEFWKRVPPEDLESAIWKLFQTGTMHHWAWPCPACGDYFVPRMKLLRWPEGASPARAGREAYLQCPNPECGAHIIDEREGEEKGRTKAWMNDRGVYVCRGEWIEFETVDGERRPIVVGEPEDTNVRSYWVSGLASPFVSWGERAEELLSAEGDPELLQTAVNAGFGELYAPGGGDVPEWKEVLKLVRPYQEFSLPEEAVLLTAGVDVQRNRLIYTIRAWGARATSWKITSGVLYGPTHERDVWYRLEDVLATRYGDRQLPVKVAFVDSGFRPGKPDQIPENMVYEFCRRNARFVWPTKGHDTQLTPIRRSKIEVEPTGGASKYGLELMHLDSDYFKRWVHERLRWKDGEPGAWYLHQGTDEDYARQIVSEARIKTPSGKPTWQRRSRENHFLDCEALATAAGYFLNVQHIGRRTERDDKDRPPSKEPERELETVGAPPPSSAEKPKSAQAEKFARMAARLNMRR